MIKFLLRFELLMICDYHLAICNKNMDTHCNMFFFQIPFLADYVSSDVHAKSTTHISWIMDDERARRGIKSKCVHEFELSKLAFRSYFLSDVRFWNFALYLLAKAIHRVSVMTFFASHDRVNIKIFQVLRL